MGKRGSEIEHGASPGILRFSPRPKCSEKNCNEVLAVVTNKSPPISFFVQNGPMRVADLEETFAMRGELRKDDKNSECERKREEEREKPLLTEKRYFFFTLLVLRGEHAEFFFFFCIVFKA